MPYIPIGDEKLYYVQRGTQGMPILFIHGSAADHLIWGKQVRALAPTARPITLDLPGHGKSSGQGRTSIEAYSDVVLGVLDALHLPRAVIAGHSMGGAIAQRMALAHPDRVAGIGLIGTGARLRVLPRILDGILNDYRDAAQFVIQNSYATPLDENMQRLALQQFLACPPAVAHGDFSACNVFDVIARLPEIHAPALVICGREDRMTPVKYSEFLVSKIPGAHLVVVDGAGHNVMIEQAGAVSQALVEFMNRL